MRAVAHNPAFAKKVGIPQSVGKDFSEADKGRKFGSGGTMKESKAMVREEMKYLKKGKAPKRVMEHEAREHESIGMEGKMKGMKRGGMAGGGYRRVADGIAIKGKTRGDMVKMASGGSVGGSYRRVADGIATKGKTKGKMVKMMMGGKCG
jgi:hypothetical protein